jgi:hypothetical protein
MIPEKIVPSKGKSSILLSIFPFRHGQHIIMLLYLSQRPDNSKTMLIWMKEVVVIDNDFIKIWLHIFGWVVFI